MSIEVMQAVWEKSEQKGSALLLLLAIADNANETSREAWPGIPYLARKTRMSERQTQRLIEYLDGTDEMAVEWKGGRGKSNLYYVLVGLPEDRIREIKDLVAEQNHQQEVIKGDKLTPFTGQKGDKMSPIKKQKGDKLTPIPEQKGDIFDGKGDIFGLNGDIAVSPEPLTINPIQKEEPEESGASLHPSLNGGAGLQVVTISPATAWQMTLSQLRMEMRRADYETWVESLAFQNFTGGVFTLASANSYARDWVSSRLASRIKGLLEGCLGQALEVKFVLRS